ncbi:MAG: HPr family phosphocarrier protein [Pseudomonadota bacterium]
MNDEIISELQIINEKGLHARAAAKLVDTIERFDAAAEVSFDNRTVSADSIMGLLMLAASKGTTIEFRAWGPESAGLTDAVSALLADRFGEDM